MGCFLKESIHFFGQKNIHKMIDAIVNFFAIWLLDNSVLMLRILLSKNQNKMSIAKPANNFRLFFVSVWCYGFQIV